MGLHRSSVILVLLIAVQLACMLAQDDQSDDEHDVVFDDDIDAVSSTEKDPTDNATDDDDDDDQDDDRGEMIPSPPPFNPFPGFDFNHLKNSDDDHKTQLLSLADYFQMLHNRLSNQANQLKDPRMFPTDEEDTDDEEPPVYYTDDRAMPSMTPDKLDYIDRKPLAEKQKIVPVINDDPRYENPPVDETYLPKILSRSLVKTDDDGKAPMNKTDDQKTSPTTLNKTDGQLPQPTANGMGGHRGIAAYLIVNKPIRRRHKRPPIEDVDDDEIPRRALEDTDDEKPPLNKTDGQKISLRTPDKTDDGRTPINHDGANPFDDDYDNQDPATFSEYGPYIPVTDTPGPGGQEVHPTTIIFPSEPPEMTTPGTGNSTCDPTIKDPFSTPQPPEMTTPGPGDSTCDPTIKDPFFTPQPPEMTTTGTEDSSCDPTIKDPFSTPQPPEMTTPGTGNSSCDPTIKDPFSSPQPPEMTTPGMGHSTCDPAIKVPFSTPQPSEVATPGTEDSSCDPTNDEYSLFPPGVPSGNPNVQQCCPTPCAENERCFRRSHKCEKCSAHVCTYPTCNDKDAAIGCWCKLRYCRKKKTGPCVPCETIYQPQPQPPLSLAKKKMNTR